MYLIVGLGNPDLKYLTTFHNIGFMALDRFALDNNLQINQKEHKALVCKTVIANQKVILAKPQTYMNLSGESVSSLINFYKIPLENVLVIYDDLDLPKGNIRFRKNGSAGSHNGMKNIVQLLSSTNFARARIGIAKEVSSPIPTIDYVLMNIPKDKLDIYKESFSNMSNLIYDFISGMESEKIMCKYNNK